MMKTSPRFFSAFGLSFSTLRAVALIGSAAGGAIAAETVSHGKGGGPVATKAPDGLTAMKSFKFDQGLKVELFAEESLLANPVAFAPDEKGRWYVAESYRQEHGVEDNRGHADWLEMDIAARTTADRLAMIHKFYPDPGAFSEKFTKHEERIVRIEDTNGDGLPDRQTVFADGFRDALDGTGAGILARGDEVWWTCIPNLWRFRDEDGNGQAERRDKLLEGFGVKFAFRGHDMHGLRFGPDGRVYFTIGDRGIHVKTREGGEVAEPDTGSVMRCYPDGSGFEVFATGVRNPQELAFDEYGNLFTGDNNSDSGDKARFVHVVEGGDSGWRMTFQYLNDRGPWNRELLWDEKEGHKSRYIVPPVANLGNGPSGLTYNPGTGLGKMYQGCFFLSDFRGGASASVVHQIRLEPSGAGFRVKEARPFVKGVLTTDCEFGNDGRLYVLDWVEGWGGCGKGRIYRFSDSAGDAPQQAATAQIIAEGMGTRSESALQAFLAHADQRVRQAAQFSLAEKGATATLLQIAQDPNATQLARIHAIWGIGQICTKQPAAAAPLKGLLRDLDSEIRAQTAKVLGEGRVPGVAQELVAVLRDSSPRARFYAALSLGKLRHSPAVPALFEMLAANDDSDAVLRHGGVMGLLGCAQSEELAARASDPSVAVRFGALLALRRQGSERIAAFLKDSNEEVVLEAARGIHDVPILGAFPALAALSSNDRLTNPRLLERVINAHYRLGQSSNAKAIATMSANGAFPAPSRREALDALSVWGAPSARDRLLNLWRPLPARGATDAVAAIGVAIPHLLRDGSASIQETAARLCAKLGLNAGEALAGLASDEKAAPGARLAALQALNVLKDDHLPKAAKVAFTARDAKLRSEALQALIALEPTTAVKLVAEAVSKGETVEKQAAVNALSRIKQAEATQEIGVLLEKLLEGKVASQIQLEILEAARYRPELASRLSEYQARDTSPLGPYSFALEGGSVERGRKVFREKVEVQCLRCHKCEIGDSAVGPELTKIGASKDRRYLLESIVFPNQMIAQGFSIVSLTLADGSVSAGRLLSEEGGKLVLEVMDPQGKPQQVSFGADQVKERFNAPSPMPENLRDSLSKWELRDLVEYLATRK
jgi:quinoprotein glucose dehydrogenase